MLYNVALSPSGKSYTYESDYEIDVFTNVVVPVGDYDREKDGIVVSKQKEPVDFYTKQILYPIYGFDKIKSIKEEYEEKMAKHGLTLLTNSYNDTHYSLSVRNEKTCIAFTFVSTELEKEIKDAFNIDINKEENINSPIAELRKETLALEETLSKIEELKQLAEKQKQTISELLEKF